MSRRAKSAPLFLLLALCTSCGEQRPTVRLVINTDSDAPHGFGVLRISVTAENGEGQTCEPIHREVTTSDMELPLRILVEQGDLYGAAMAYRVEAIAGEDGRSGEVVLTVQESDVFWPDEGSRDENIVLESACMRRDCDPGQRCVGGQCVVIPGGDIFADMGRRTEDFCGRTP